jgi:peptidoglycan-associated lipoprotein
MVGRAGVSIVLGVVVLFGQGCGMKWLQSGGDSESGQASSGNSQSDQASSRVPGSGGSPDGAADSRFPGFSRSMPGSDLSGFSQNPQEERLAHAPGSYQASLSPSDVSAHRRAELTREEKAALEAGLQDVFFGYDQWIISQAGMESLNRDAGYLKDHPNAVLKIEGHCDERGTADYNIVLGDKRAKAARTYLIEAGVSPKQVSIVSYGKERPFCFDRHESCYQQNRRGHMLLSVKK